MKNEAASTDVYGSWLYRSLHAVHTAKVDVADSVLTGSGRAGLREKLEVTRTD